MTQDASMDPTQAAELRFREATTNYDAICDIYVKLSEEDAKLIIQEINALRKTVEMQAARVRILEMALDDWHEMEIERSIQIAKSERT